MKCYLSAGVLALLVVVAGVTAVPELTAQSTGGGRERLAPSVPAAFQALDLLLAVPDTAPPVGSDLEVVRFGQAGRLSRPNALDIPERPQALELAAWDWLRPQGRALELAARDPYRIWVEIHDGMQGVLVSSDHLELFWGTVEWKDTTTRATQRHISAGDILIRGRGTARITRDARGISLTVLTGRFEVEEQGQLTTVLAAGQESVLARAASTLSRSEVGNETRRAAEQLRDVHRDLLAILLAGEHPDGASLSVLWERLVDLGPWYSYAEELRVQGLSHPDLMLRDMGEVLRILAAFRFSPPPAMGM
ncbi:MAG TPA: hypothetical protein VJ932_05165 [Alkalispirochaeta sp.]|nr:hypothetical protein [Alkalispirochaeta sp.]